MNRFLQIWQNMSRMDILEISLLAVLWILVVILRLWKNKRRSSRGTSLAWNKARVAILNPNGNTFDLRYHLPVVSRTDVPASFEMGRSLTVDGDTLTRWPGRRKEQRFTVGEIASIVIEPPAGENTLCDKDNNILFSFRWSDKNAALLAQYLMNRKVRFMELVGKGETIPPELPEFPRSFAVGKKRLSVDGEKIRWKRPLHRAVTFSISEVQCTAIHLPEETVSLLDRDGKVLAQYKNSMENADYMHNYLVQSLDNARPL